MAQDNSNYKNGYSRLSMAEFKGMIGAKVEAIEMDIKEIKSNCVVNNQVLQEMKTDLAVMVSTGTVKAQEACVGVWKLDDRVRSLEEKEKQRVTRSKNIAAIFGAIGGAVLSFIMHFVSSWLTGKK